MIKKQKISVENNEAPHRNKWTVIRGSSTTSYLLSISRCLKHTDADYTKRLEHDWVILRFDLVTVVKNRLRKSHQAMKNILMRPWLVLLILEILLESLWSQVLCKPCPWNVRFPGLSLVDRQKGNWLKQQAASFITIFFLRKLNWPSVSLHRPQWRPKVIRNTLGSFQIVEAAQLKRRPKCLISIPHTVT